MWSQWRYRTDPQSSVLEHEATRAPNPNRAQHGRAAFASLFVAQYIRDESGYENGKVWSQRLGRELGGMIAMLLGRWIWGKGTSVSRVVCWGNYFLGSFPGPYVPAPRQPSQDTQVTSTVLVPVAIRWEIKLNPYMQEKSSQILFSEHTHLDPIKIVNSQNCAPLVFIAKETESFGFPSLLVPHQINVNNLPISIYFIKE